MTCLLYELPYMHFLFEYHILTFLESVPFSSLVYSTAASRARPSESYRKFLALLDRSYLPFKSSISSTTGLQTSNTRYSTFGIFSSSESPTIRINTTEQTKCLHLGGSSERSPEPVRWRLVPLGLMVRTYLTYVPTTYLPRRTNQPIPMERTDLCFFLSFFSLDRSQKPWNCSREDCKLANCCSLSGM